MELVGEKSLDLVTLCLLKENGDGREQSPHSVLEKHPKLKQIAASFGALQNKDAS